MKMNEAQICDQSPEKARKFHCLIFFLMKHEQIKLNIHIPIEYYEYPFKNYRKHHPMKEPSQNEMAHAVPVSSTCIEIQTKKRLEMAKIKDKNQW